MTDLTDLTLAEARDGLRAKTFSALELARAHNAAIEKARALNAFVLETPEIAETMATASDERLRRDEAGPLEGIPLGIKDLFCTRDVRTTAGSEILGNFVPPYESTVTSQLWRDGAVMLGKLNNDEFAMGSSNETSAFGPVVSPWRRLGSNVGAGAAGAIEAIFGVLAIRDQVAPPTINLDNPSVETPIDLVPHQAKKRPIDTVLSNSFGFGGTNASLVMRRAA